MRRDSKGLHRLVLRGLVILTCLADSASAQPSSDRAGALLVYPYVTVDEEAGTDTVLQLSNAANAAVTVDCFYENAASTCSNNPSMTCSDNTDCDGGTCETAIVNVDFRISLGAHQPFGWHASDGGAVAGSGSGAAPPVSGPFIGSLRCVAVDPQTGSPTAGAIEGVATVASHSGPGDDLDLAKYNAISFALRANNGDRVLILGGEYDRCPFIWTLQHALEGAEDPIDGSTLRPSFILMPCAVDFATGAPQRVVVHFNVYNELGQRLGTSVAVTVHRADPLVRIHPTIFNASFHGTLTAQTRIQSVGGGLIAVALERRDPGGGSFSPSLIRDPVGQGARPEADVIVLP